MRKTTFMKIAAFAAAAASIFTSCRKDPEVTSFEVDYSKAEAVYTGAQEGVASFEVTLGEAGTEAKYSQVKFTLNTKMFDIQDFKIEDGSYEIAADAALMNATSGTALSDAGSTVAFESGSIEVAGKKIQGNVQLVNGHTLKFATVSPLNLSSKEVLPSFEAKVNNNSFIDLDILIRPASTSMNYFYTVMPAERFAGKDDATILSEIHSFYKSIIAMGLTEQGNVRVTVAETGALDPLTEYCLYVYGVSGDEPSTALHTFKFTTSDQNDPTDVTFKSTVEDITKRSAYVQVTPSDNSVLYVWDIVRKETFDSYGKVEGEFIGKWLGDQVDGSYWKNIADVVAGCGARGPQDYEYTTLSAGTEYVVFAVCVDKNGNTVSKAYVSEPFTTEAAKISDIIAYQDLENFYDGDALAEANPSKYASYAGRYYVNTTVTVEDGPAAHTYAAFSSESTDSYSDEQLISALVKSGVKDKVSCWFLVKKNGTNTPMYTFTVAEDANGDFGVVDRYTFYLNAKMCAPISDIIQ